MASGFLMMLVCCCFVASTFGATVRGPPPQIRSPSSSSLYVDALKKIGAITADVETIFEEFIQRNMGCHDVSQCKEEMTSLRLTALPEVHELQVNSVSFRQTWVGSFEEQLQGMQIFAKILNDVADQHHRSFNGRAVDAEMQRSFQHIKSVSSVLKGYIHALRDNVQTAHCVEMSLPLNEEAICEICQQPSLPSRPLEIIRNYQFLLQMRDYFMHFKSTLLFLVIKTPPVQC